MSMTPERFAEMQAKVREAQPVAFSYKGEPYFDGSKWVDTVEVTTSEQLAKWKDADAIPLYCGDLPALMAEMLEALGEARASLELIAELDPAIHSDEGFNEWGEADCFCQAQGIARAAMSKESDK